MFQVTLRPVLLTLLALMTFSSSAEETSLQRFLKERIRESDRDGDTLAYSQTTVVKIYGNTFDHTDENQLRRA